MRIIKDVVQRRKTTEPEIEEGPMNRKQMLKDGWLEKKEFWMKKRDYGTWIWGKENRRQIQK